MVKERKEKVDHVLQRHQKSAKLNLDIVEIQVFVLELSLKICVLEAKITSVVQECHFRNLNVLLLVEHVETSVNVMGKFFMDIVLLNTTPSNVVLNLLQYVQLKNLNHVHLSHQKSAKPNLDTVEIQVFVLDLSLKCCPQSIISTSAGSQDCSKISCSSGKYTYHCKEIKL